MSRRDHSASLGFRRTQRPNSDRISQANGIRLEGETLKHWNATAKTVGLIGALALSAIEGPQIDFSTGMRVPAGLLYGG